MKSHKTYIHAASKTAVNYVLNYALNASQCVICCTVNSVQCAAWHHCVMAIKCHEFGMYCTLCLKKNAPPYCDDHFVNL